MFHTAPESTSVALAPPGGTGLDGVRVARVGLRFRRELAFAQWADVGRRVGRHADASCWWLGDWLLYGEQRYGQRYKEAISLTGLDYQTLRNYAAVARRFAVVRRRDRLSFQHHAELTALPDDEQERWLDRAEAGGWSRNVLRRHLRVQRPGAAAEASRAVRLAVGSDRIERWQQAAQHDDSELTTWIVTTLDAAATERLSRRGEP